MPIDIIVTIICSVIASSAFWEFLIKRSEKNDVKTKMLVGLAHDRITYLGMKYIERGWVSQDEYENLYNYLYSPYKELGGNGSAERVMNEVKKLEIRRVGL